MEEGGREVEERGRREGERWGREEYCFGRPTKTLDKQTHVFIMYV